MMLLVSYFFLLKEKEYVSVSPKSFCRRPIYDPFLLPQPPATYHPELEGGQGEHLAAEDTYGKEVMNGPGWQNKTYNIYGNKKSV